MALPLFFFYGTLIAGSDNAAARAVHARLHRIGPATMPGALWAIPDPAGWYPALVAKPKERLSRLVHGVLYKAIDGFGAEQLARLDEWEDYRADRAASLYVREAVTVTTATGVGFVAQVYRFNQSLPADAQPIPDGDFRAWLQGGQRAEFEG